MNTNNFKGLSLSHGTLLNDDLIPTFEEFLELHAPDVLKEIKSDEDYYYILEFGRYDGETAYWLLDVLFDKLNDLAPEGYYFGAHPGDGSDFGFWQLED